MAYVIQSKLTGLYLKTTGSFSSGWQDIYVFASYDGAVAKLQAMNLDETKYQIQTKSV
jgi:hypothetical protein